MKRFLLAFSVLFAGSIAWGQCGTLVINPTAPFITDGNGRRVPHLDCIGSASSAVTSVTGTANQINSTVGTTPVLTLSSTITLPGTINKVTITAPTTAATIAFPTDNATITFQGTDTYLGRATTDTLTNKTYDTAGAGNSFSINGVAVTANTGTGAVARATSPTFVTPVLGTPASGVMTNMTGLALAGTPLTTRGDLLVVNSTPGLARLALGAANTVLHGSSTDPAYSAVVSADLNITTTACTAPQILTAISATGIGTCSAPILTQNSQSAAYTTVLGDAGKSIYHPGADTTARTWTIDSNANVAYTVGTCITFINDTSAGVITIAITSDTLLFAGTATTGSRTLAASNIATACKMTSTRWIISGSSGLT